jgi:heme exporter protein B
MLKETKALLQKEMLMEWRNRSALAGMVLYVVSTVFVSYLSFKNVIEVSVWNALFWIIILFASINASAKSFLSEREGRMLYYYTLVSPQVFILAKIIYNGFLMILLSLICFFFYSLFMGNIVPNLPLFLLIVVLGSLGLSSLLSMMSAIAAKAGNNFTIMAILSFPIIMPMLMVIIRLSQSVINGMNFTHNLKFFAVLFFLDVIILTLAYLLFPYLWKD